MPARFTTRLLVASLRNTNSSRSRVVRLALMALATAGLWRCARDATLRSPSHASSLVTHGAQHPVARAPAADASDASIANASDAGVTDAAVLAWMTHLPAPVRGSLVERLEERVECGYDHNSGERVMVSASRAALTLRAQDAPGPTVAWARSNGFARVVVELDSDTDACISGETIERGGLATVTLPSAGWTIATVRAAASDGESGPFVMGVRADAMGAPAQQPAPIAPIAPNEARAHWLFEQREGCDGDNCATRTLFFAGAGAQRLVSHAPDLPNRCEAQPIASGRTLFAYWCTGAGFTSWAVQRTGRDRYAVVESYTSHGQCGGPCPTQRTTLHRFTLPEGTRLVPDPLRLVDRR